MVRGPKKKKEKWKKSIPTCFDFSFHLLHFVGLFIKIKILQKTPECFIDWAKNIPLKTVFWVSLFIVKKKTRKKEKQSTLTVNPLLWQVQGYLKQLFHPSSGYEYVKQK